jgi:PAS domain S-box-containing protein
MGWLYGVVAFLGLWVIVLLRQVRQLNQVVHHQLHRQVAADERYADLASSVSDVVFALDLRGRFTAVNAAAESICGCPRAEILRGSLLDFIAPDQRAVAELWLQRAPASRSHHDVRFQIAIAARDGRALTLVGRVRVLSREGAPIGFEGLARPLAARLTGNDADGADSVIDRRQVA